MMDFELEGQNFVVTGAARESDWPSAAGSRNLVPRFPDGI